MPGKRGYSRRGGGGRWQKMSLYYSLLMKLFSKNRSSLLVEFSLHFTKKEMLLQIRGHYCTLVIFKTLLIE